MQEPDDGSDMDARSIFDDDDDDDGDSVSLFDSALSATPSNPPAVIYSEIHVHIRTQTLQSCPKTGKVHGYDEVRRCSHCDIQLCKVLSIFAPQRALANSDRIVKPAS